MLEAYSVAVRISLVNNVTSGLLGISSAFARVHGDAAKLRSELNAIKLTMLTGGAMAGAGFLGLGMISKTLPDAKEYARQIALMNAAGMKQAEIQRAIAASWSLSTRSVKAGGVPTATATSNLEAVRELRTVFGTTEEALRFLPSAQRLAYILQSVRGGDVKGEVQGAARALDLRNATTSQAAAEQQANLMTQAIVASGGVLTAKDFASTFKYGRTATLGWSNEFAYRILPSLMQELKSGGGAGAGGGPGNPLMSAYSAVVQGTVPQKALGVWSQLGLLDRSKVEWTKAGEAKGLRPGAISRSDLFIENPYLWTQTVLRPALERAGHDTEKEQRQVLGYLFPNRTAGAVMSTMLFQSRAIERDRRMFGIAKGLDAYQSLVANDPNAADAMLAAQWKNLLTVIGYEILPVVVSGTLRLIDGLRGLVKFSRDHPNLTKTLVVGFAALSAAMAFGGTVLLLNGAFRGLALAFRLFGAAAMLPSLTKGMIGLAGAFKTFAAAEMTVMGVSGPASAALAGLGASIAGFLATLGMVALPAAGAVGLAMYENARDKRILANPDAANPYDRAFLQKRLQGEARIRRFFGMSSDVQESGLSKLAPKRGSTPTVSPFVSFAQQGQQGGGVGAVYMDSRRVGDIVFGGAASQMGGVRAPVGRHDPRATPSSPAGVYRK